MHKNEVPIALADVRLVIPFELVRPGGEKEYSDVVVENIAMERHTTGIDPYTGTDYGTAEIPEEHQYDPTTGLPIFHRYIAGTRDRIEWPWEVSENTEDAEAPSTHTPEQRSWLSKTASTIRHPITSLRSWRGREKEEEDTSNSQAPATEESPDDGPVEIEQKKTPRSQEVRRPEAYDFVDSTRNIVEGAESMSYTLLAPPMPPTLGKELYTDIKEFTREAQKDEDAPRLPKVKHTSNIGNAAREADKAKKRAAEQMKTPMQLRWELEQAKKRSDLKKNPLVETDALLLALGQHMQKNGKKPKKPKQPLKVEDVD